jgi:hypothetical protein
MKEYSRRLDFLTTVSQKKNYELREFEPVIRNCPVCIKDTEQRAFYVYQPDRTINVETPTNPKVKLQLLQKFKMAYNWFILDVCKNCGNAYIVMGIEQYKIKNLPEKVVKIEVNLIQTCCDVCYNEWHNYRLADVFINLSGGGSIYLCTEHADDVEKERKRTGSYTTLVSRIGAWKAPSETPKAIQIKGTLVILDGRDEAFLKKRFRDGANSRPMLISDDEKGDSAISLARLTKMGLLTEKKEGLILKKKRITITDLGVEVVENLDRMYEG